MDFKEWKFWTWIVIVTLLNVLVPVYLVASLIWLIKARSIAPVVALTLATIAAGEMTAVHARSTRWLRLPWWHALLMPVSAGLYVLISANSYVQYHLRGGNVWKGRRYDPALLRSAIPEE